MMKVDIAEARKNVGSEQLFSFEKEPGELSVSSPDYSFEGLVTVQGNLVYTGVCYRVSGKVCAIKHFSCDRCLADCRSQQEHEFLEDFRQGVDPSGEAETFEGDSIDIEPLVRDTLFSSQSLSNLCKPDCRGLCPVCGHDLNKGDCGCDRFVADPRLAGLEQLLKKD